MNESGTVDGLDAAAASFSSLLITQRLVSSIMSSYCTATVLSPTRARLLLLEADPLG